MTYNSRRCPCSLKDRHQFPKLFYVGSSPIRDTIDILNAMKKLSPFGQENLEDLVSLLKLRLQSSGKAKSTDTNGNVVYVDRDIFSKESLEAFVLLSLSDFNQTPTFTFYTLEDTKIVETFADILVEGAVLSALASKALIERGREFMIVDGGVTIDPPTVSELMNTQYSTLLGYHWEKLKTIKSHISDFK